MNLCLLDSVINGGTKPSSSLGSKGKLLGCAAMPILLCMFVLWCLCWCYNEIIMYFNCTSAYEFICELDIHCNRAR